MLLTGENCTTHSKICPSKFTRGIIS